MFSHPEHFVYPAIVLVTALALWKGAMAERIGAAANLIAALGVATIHMLWSSTNAIPLLVADAGLAMIFLGLAVRYASVWLGGAMLLQAVQFSLHAFYMVAERPHDRLYFRINNVDTLLVLAALAFGAVQSWRRRIAQRRQEEERAAALANAEHPPGAAAAS